MALATSGNKGAAVSFFHQVDSEIILAMPQITAMMTPYVAGVPAYRKIVEEVAAKDCEGFVFG